MTGVLVDANVILDVSTDDPVWADWSESTLNQYSASYPLCINAVIYAEIPLGFERIEDVEHAMAASGFTWLPIPKEALFFAGKALLQYRRRQGNTTALLPDFFIGAHAAVSGLWLLTRDAMRMHTYFPAVHLITPPSS